MSAQTTQPFQAKEGCTAKLTATIRDEDEAVIPAASLTTLTLLLYDQATQLASPGSTAAVINSRNRQDVLNVNGCTVSTGGALAMVFTPADNVILDTSSLTERHVALFEYTYAVTKAGKEEVLIDVVNLTRTT